VLREFEVSRSILVRCQRLIARNVADDFLSFSLALAKSCVLCCVSHDGDGDDHGVRRANTARAHARWWHIVASHEATDTLHRAMCLAMCLPGGMVDTITVDSITFYYIAIDNLI